MAKDDFAYLEETAGARAREWVSAQNARTLGELEGDSRFQDFHKRALATEQARTSMDTAGLIALPRRIWIQHNWVYQVWIDSRNPQGIWRRATLSSFLDHKPDWDVLLDLDALSRADGESWTLASADISPNGGRILLELKREGLLTSTWREFDIKTHSFVVDGFHVPSSKSDVMWRSDDVVMITTDLPPAPTNEGRPIAVREWRRGQPLSAAIEVLRGEQDDYLVTLDSSWGTAFAGAEEDRSGRRAVHFVRTDSKFRAHWWRLDPAGRLLELKPSPVATTTPIPYKDQYILTLREDWHVNGRTWKKGTVVSIPAAEMTRAEPSVRTVFEPKRDMSILFPAARTDGCLLLFGTYLNYSRLWCAKLQGDRWTTNPLPLPDHGTMLPEYADFNATTVLVRYEDFLQSPSLYAVDLVSNTARRIAQIPPQFDTDTFVVEQRETKSADGVLVPYSLVRPRRMLHPAPAIVIGYGASGSALSPYYSGTLGKLWLERGGVHVIANVRGGRERGAEWAVQGLGRQHTYDDMVAVTEDLIRNGISSRKRIGFIGHSNGGLLGGVMLTQHPDLFGAIVLKAPVLDQFRLDLGGHGFLPWLKEYGSPSIPEERDFLQRTSPFQNLKPGAQLPRPFIITSTTDETVHPAQSRRFAAKMKSLHMPFLFYETPSGGHGLAVTPSDIAHLDALTYIYLTRQLMDSSAEQARAASSSVGH